MANKSAGKNLGNKQAAPFKKGGGRDMGHKNTAKGTPRKGGGKGKIY